MPVKKNSSSTISIDHETNDNLINFYEQKAVKKYASKNYNPHFAETQISIPSRIGFIGSTGSGKTSALLNYIYRSQDTFIHIYVVYKEEEPLYLYLGDKLKDNITFYKGLDKLPNADDLPFTHDGQVLLIFDDQVAEKDQSKISDYFLRGRKIGNGITIMYLSQSFYAIPKFLRQQMNYLIIVKIGSVRDLRSILKDYSLGVDIDKLVSLYKTATQTFPSFFKIALGAPPDKTFSKNFTTFLNPN